MIGAPSVKTMARCLSFFSRLSDWDSRDLFTQSAMAQYGSGIPMFDFMAHEHGIDRQRKRNRFFTVQSPFRYLFLRILSIFLQSQAFLLLDQDAQHYGVQTVLNITKIELWRSIGLKFDMTNIIRFVIVHGQPKAVATALKLARVAVHAAYSEKDKSLNLSAVSELLEPLYRANLNDIRNPPGATEIVEFIIKNASAPQLLAVVEHTELISALIIQRFNSEYQPELDNLLSKVGFQKCLETVQFQEKNTDKVSLLMTYRDILQRQQKSKTLRFKDTDEVIIRILVVTGWNRAWLIRAWFPEVPSDYNSREAPDLIKTLEILIIIAAWSSLPRFVLSSRRPGANILRRLPQFLFKSITV